MKALSLSLLALLLGAGALPAQDAQIAALQKTYPLTTCPISGEKLGGPMGAPVDYLYKTKDANGKETTRLIRFCCPGCISQFKANPGPALQKIDQAAAAAKKSAAVSTPHPSMLALGSRSPCCTSAGGCCDTTNGCCESAH